MTPGRLVRRLLRAELYSIIRLYQPISARLHTRHEGASFADLHDDVQLVVFLVLEGFKQLYNVRVTEVLLDLNLLSELCDPYVIHPIKTHLPQEASKGARHAYQMRQVRDARRTVFMANFSLVSFFVTNMTHPHPPRPSSQLLDVSYAMYTPSVR